MGEKTKRETFRKLSEGATKIFPLLIGGLSTGKNILTCWDYTHWLGYFYHLEITRKENI